MIHIKSILLTGTPQRGITAELFSVTGAEKIVLNGFTKLFDCKIKVRDKKAMEELRGKLADMTGISRSFILMNYEERKERTVEVVQ